MSSVSYVDSSFITSVSHKRLSLFCSDNLLMILFECFCREDFLMRGCRPLLDSSVLVIDCRICLIKEMFFLSLSFLSSVIY